MINVRGADEFWSRYQSNKPAVYTTLAHYARAGINVVRVFGSVPSWYNYTFYLPHHNWNVGQTYEGWVKDFLERCDDHELGALYVIGNSFGTSPDSVGGPADTYLPYGIFDYYDIYPDQGVLLKIQDSAGGDRLVLMRTFPNFYPVLDVPYAGFFSWPYGTSNLADWRDTNRVDYLKGFATAHSGATGVGAMPGLQSYQLYNEAVRAAPWVNPTTPGPYGTILQSVFNQVTGGMNPHGLKSHFGSVNDLEYIARTPGCTPHPTIPECCATTDPLWANTNTGTGFAAASLAPVANIGWWTYHGAFDPFIRYDACSNSPDRSYGQFTRLRDWAHACLAGKFGGSWSPRPVETDEAGSRNITGQMLSDLEILTVNRERDATPARVGQGYIQWALCPTEAASIAGGSGAEGSALLLSDGTVISPREHEAVRGNYRKNRTITPWPTNGSSTVAAQEGTDLENDLSDFVAAGLHYEVGVLSNARLWTVPVTVFNNAVSAGAPTEVDTGAGVNGPRTRATAPFVSPGRTAKLRAAMIPGAQFFTRDGLVMYRNQ